MNFKNFQKEFSKHMENITDEQLVKDFAEMGCDVEIVPKIGDIVIPKDSYNEYLEYTNEHHNNKLPFGVYHWRVVGLYKAIPYQKSKRYKYWLLPCEGFCATHVKLRGGCDIICSIDETVKTGKKFEFPKEQTWNQTTLLGELEFYSYELGRANQQTPENSYKIEYPRSKSK